MPVRWARPSAMLPEDTKERRDPAEYNVSRTGRKAEGYGGMDKEDEVHISSGASLPHERRQ